FVIFSKFSLFFAQSVLCSAQSAKSIPTSSGVRGERCFCSTELLTIFLLGEFVTSVCSGVEEFCTTGLLTVFLLGEFVISFCSGVESFVITLTCCLKNHTSERKRKKCLTMI